MDFKKKIIYVSVKLKNFLMLVFVVVVPLIVKNV